MKPHTRTHTHVYTKHHNNTPTKHLHHTHASTAAYLCKRDLSLVSLRTRRSRFTARVTPAPSRQNRITSTTTAAAAAAEERGLRERALDADARANVVDARLVVRPVDALDLRKPPAGGRPEPHQLFKARVFVEVFVVLFLRGRGVVPCGVKTGRGGAFRQ